VTRHGLGRVGLETREQCETETHTKISDKLQSWGRGTRRLKDIGGSRAGGGGLQTWRGERVVAPSVSSGYGQSGSGQAGTDAHSVKSIGAERRGLLPLIIFTHECLSNYGLQPHVGAAMLLHRLASTGHKAWERDRQTDTQGPGSQRGARERGGREEEERERHSEHISAKQHVSFLPSFLPPFPSLLQGGDTGLGFRMPPGLAPVLS
jgi:hypothetical protein